MKATLIKTLVDAILSMASEEMVKEFLDGVLDAAENAIEKSTNTTDDAVLLPVISRIRSIFGIEDND